MLSGRPRVSSIALEPAVYYELLQDSIKFHNLILGKLVHSLMIRNCYKPGLFVQNNLLGMYCKCGELSTAQQMFDRMPRRDVATWNSLMVGYSYMGQWDRAMDVFKEARNLEVALDRYSYAGVLGVCGESGDLRTGRIVHGLVVVSGLAPRAFLTNSLINMYMKCGRIDEVRLVFDHADELDEVSWNSLLSAYVRMGWPEVAVNILVWMHRNGVKLNSFALGSILKACMGFDDSKEVRKMLHGCVIKVGLDLDYFVGSAMLDMYAKSGGLDDAIKIFGSIPNQSVVVFNAMIGGFSRLGVEASDEVRIEALRLFSEMLRRQMRPSKFTFKSVLEACNLTRAYKHARKIHAQVIMNHRQDDEFIGSALVELYSNSGSLEDGLKCFNATCKKDVVIWTSMIKGYVQNQHFERAGSLFNEFLSLGGKPDQFMISSVMNACSDLGLMRSGEQIQGFAIKAGLDKFTVYSNSQIDMYVKSGNNNDAIMTFQDMGTLDVVSWSAMILSHALLGYARDALMLFEKMKECRVAPNHISFLAVLTACSNGQLVDEGLRYFESMKIEYGMAPDLNHCVCIVNLLGRAGRLADADDFISTSGYNSDPVIWRAFLGACQFHGDTVRGLQIAELLLELEPSAAASYMFLYNMYLDIGKISLAMRTRGLMRERGVNKEISISWIEIGALVYSFVAGDNSHLQSHAILEKLEEMLFKLKQKGYANIKGLEFEYRSQEWEKSLMNSHGEKLAVALGINSLPESVPIRVMKNLKVCNDCHTVLKLFSENEGREIILRDPSRFHHFRWGSCSCGDYW